MSEMVLFVGTYDIPEGKLEAFYEGARTMTEIVRDHEPRVLLVGHYVNTEQTEGTSIHLHPDAASFDFHMEVASRMIETGTQTVDVKRIEFYGQPSQQIVERLSQAFEVQVKQWKDGYSRISAS